MIGIYRLQSRWKIRLPEVYEAMLKRGLFEGQSGSALEFWDVRWFDLLQIADFQPPEYVIDGLVPFAKQGRGSIWAWWPAHVAPGGLPVVLSPRDSNTGEIYASNFEGFLFRQVVEEMADVQMDDFPDGPGQTISSIKAKLELIRPCLPQKWTDALSVLAANELTDQPNGFFGFLSQANATLIIRRTLNDTRNNLEFKQHWEDIRPLGPSGLYKSITLFGTDFSPDVVSSLRKKFQSQDDSDLVINHPWHGDLLFPVRYYPLSHYSRQSLAAVGLVKPPMISIDCPVEGCENLILILRELLCFGPAIRTCRSVEPLANLLASDDPWGDLRWT
jgi:hypothetical protein